MKRLILFLLLVFCSKVVVSQVPILGNNPGNGTIMNAIPYGTVEEIPYIKPNTKGTTLLYNDYITGDLSFTNGLYVEHLEFNIDLKTDLIIFERNGLTKSIPGNKVKIISTPFGILTRDVNVGGFVENVYESSYTKLLKITELKLLPASYNQALDLGEPADKFVKRDKYILFYKGLYIEIVKSRKSFSKEFDDQQEILTMLRHNKINLKEEKDMIKFASLLNDKANDK